MMTIGAPEERHKSLELWASGFGLPVVSIICLKLLTVIASEAWQSAVDWKNFSSLLPVPRCRFPVLSTLVSLSYFHNRDGWEIMVEAGFLKVFVVKEIRMFSTLKHFDRRSFQSLAQCDNRNVRLSYFYKILLGNV